MENMKMEKNIEKIVVPKRWEGLVRFSGTASDWKIWIDCIDFYGLVDGKVVPLVRNGSEYEYGVVDDWSSVIEKIDVSEGAIGRFDLKELYEDDVIKLLEDRA